MNNYNNQEFNNNNFNPNKAKKKQSNNQKKHHKNKEASNPTEQNPTPGNKNRVGEQDLKKLDDFIQGCLNKFKFIDPLPSFYEKTGNDKDLIISHKSTIPDLVIWNKTFNKNECFEDADTSKKNDFPRFTFFLRLNKDKDSKNKNAKNKEKKGKKNKKNKKDKKNNENNNNPNSKTEQNNLIKEMENLNINDNNGNKNNFNFNNQNIIIIINLTQIKKI